MLLPALASAKKKAQRIQCASNQRQLQLAWIMFADDNSDQIAPNNDTSMQSINSWVKGIMKWDTVLAPYSDNYNTTNLSESVLGPYCSHVTGIYKCPGDIKDAAKGPRVRSISMNCYMNGQSQGALAIISSDLATYKNFLKTTAITQPGPSDAWVFTDEQGDSINDGFFFVDMSQTANWYDLPANYHGATGAFSFADGHVESHKWRDAAIANRMVTGQNPSSGQTTAADPAAGDLSWVQQRSSSLR